MKTTVDPFEGYSLLQNGLQELARVEANGIRIDMPLLKATKKKLSDDIRDRKQALQEDRVWKVWRRRFGDKSSLASRDQLAKILFEELKLESKGITEKGKPSTDEENLRHIEDPFVQNIIRFLKYEKALNTFIRGIETEIVDGRLHPSFNLHMARSFRSSSSDPNFQNFPVRDKEISKIIRSLFIASKGCVLCENDFKGIEVALSAAYHKDPNFISYITTPGKDMHRDMAAQLYMLEPGQVDKDTRYGAKNKFVFPQFYGSFYISCAKDLWEWIAQGKLKGPDGKSLYKYLRKQGIAGLGACDPEQDPEPGTFEAHVQEVERDFWDNRFKVYGKWKRKWYDQYVKDGSFDILTGFHIEGYWTRNQTTNLPVQGAAFHCLLWCLIQINRILRKEKMKSMIVGQIHDSLIGDIREDELADYLSIVEETTLNGLRKHYKWLAVPPEIEFEISPPGMSWFDKRPFLFKNGRFLHPKDNTKSTADAQKFFRTLTTI